MLDTIHSAADLYCAFWGEAAPVVDFVTWVAGAYGLTGSIRALDVGCGPGRLLAPLGALGWSVVGLEPDADCRAAAAARADAQVRAGGFNEVASLTEDDEPYDMVLGINSSFAHVLTPEARADALAQCRQALRWGGVILLDLPHLLHILFDYRGAGHLDAELDGRKVHLERRHAIDFHAATFTTHEIYTIHEPDGSTRTFEKDHPYAITSFPELAHLLEHAGFADIRTYTSYAARAPERLGSGRMIIAATAA